MRFRVSMYADDAVIFIRPNRNDVQNLRKILHLFGETTGLTTNFQKTSVTPISCNNINLDAVLADLPMARAAFPIKYLGYHYQSDG